MKQQTLNMKPKNTAYTSSTVLIIEDQATIRSVMRRLLEKDDQINLVDFANGNDAINYLKHHPVDLVISDIYMPKGNGFDVLSAIRNRSMANDLPVLFVTGEATKDDIVHAIDIGATDYLIKPFEQAEFVTKVKNLLEKYKNPSEWDLKIRKAESEFLSENIDDAIILFTELLKTPNTSPRCLTDLAQCLVLKEDTDKAIELLNAAIEMNGLYFPAYALLANIELQRNNVEQAKNALLKELSINGKQANRRLLLAKIYTTEGDMQKSLDELRKGLIDNPKDEALLLAMGDYYAQTGVLDKSIHYYLRTRKNHPECMQALEGIIDVNLGVGTPGKAHSTFKDLFRSNPKQIDIHLAKAKLFEKEGDLDSAIGCLDLYLEHLPESIETLKHKAFMLTKLNKHADALPLYKQITKLFPTAENYAKVGLINLKLQQFSIAAKYYEKAISINPDNPRYHFNLGYANESLKMYAQALKFYTKVIDIDPANTDAQTALNRVKSIMQTKQQEQTLAKVAPQNNDNHFTVQSLERYPLTPDKDKK